MKKTDKPAPLPQDASELERTLDASKDALKKTTLHTDAGVTGVLQRQLAHARAGRDGTHAAREIALENALAGENAQFLPKDLVEGVAERDKAMEAVGRAEQRVSRGAALQAEWESLVNIFADLSKRLLDGKIALDDYAEREQRAAALLARDIGNVYAGFGLNHASALFLIRQTKPLYAEAFAGLVKEHRDHVAQMRKFAKEHDLPAYCVEDLPTFE